MLKNVPPEEIPASEDICSAETLAALLDDTTLPDPQVIAAGDIMLDGRARDRVERFGPDSPFDAVRPLLQRAPIVVGNLEGPFASVAEREDRNYSYKVDPALAGSLARAGINVVTLANNHLLDCGRAGVIETLDALRAANVAAIGAGSNTAAAHAPVIARAGDARIGLLGYYWNRRTAATAELPGSAMDSPEAVAADVRALRARVDHVVVVAHWGVPYEREPSAEMRIKARHAIDCGADAVVGHHPHIVQPFEVYRGRPILYSVGNFAFGSGNSRAEGLLVGLRFAETGTAVDVWPIYVKNRDPRVDYQPKVLRGAAGQRVLRAFAAMSGGDGRMLSVMDGRARLELPAVPAVAHV